MVSCLTANVISCIDGLLRRWTGITRALLTHTWQALVISFTQGVEVTDYERSGEYYQHAFEIARTIGDPSIVVRSLNRVGNWHLNVERPLEALVQHQEALQIFQELDDKTGIAETLDLLGMASYLSGDLV